MAKKSLVAQAEQPTTALVVPGNPGINLPPPLQSITPYVQFLNAKSPSFGKVLAALPETEEGDLILMGDRPERLNPFRFILIRAGVHYSEIDHTGTILASTTDPEIARANKALKEYIEAVVLVFASRGLVAARCRFSSARLKAIRTALDGLDAAQTPGWGKQSPEHATALLIEDPRFRFVSTVKTSWTTSRGNGFRYQIATAICRPAGQGDIAAIRAWFADPVSLLDLHGAVQSYEDSLAEARSKGAGCHTAAS